MPCEGFFDAVPWVRLWTSYHYILQIGQIFVEDRGVPQIEQFDLFHGNLQAYRHNQLPACTGRLAVGIMWLHGHRISMLWKMPEQRTQIAELCNNM
jgi:hypothetical protein